MITTVEDLREKIALGETSYVQFKQRIDSLDGLEVEIVAFANSFGGSILVGVNNDKTLNGLSDAEIEQYIQNVSNVSSQRINPPINTSCNTLIIDDNKIFIIGVPSGPSKPYITKNGVVWAKVAADKRKISRDELKRLFHSSKDFHPDEEPVNAGIEALDLTYFSKYYFMLKNQAMVDSGYTMEELLKRMGVTEGGHLNLAGLLFFGKEPELIRPVFQVKAVAFYGNAIEDTAYRDSIDTVGNIESQYSMCLDFLKRNLRYIQKDKSFNSTGDLEVSQVALEEALMNAFFHRDYTKASPIRLLVFDDRVELISPGSLPNHLTIENIQYGDTVIRNHRIVSFGTKILPFRGLGSGIRRILKEHPNTELINDIDGQQFKVIMRRALQ